MANCNKIRTWLCTVAGGGHHQSYRQFLGNQPSSQTEDSPSEIQPAGIVVIRSNCPTCRCSVRRSLILVASSTSEPCAITRSARFSRPMKRRGASQSVPDRAVALSRDHDTIHCLLANSLGLGSSIKLVVLTSGSRQALRYIIRNTSFPPRVRAEAQLQLTQMHCYTRPTQIRNRCILGGKGRGILSDFKLTRVSEPMTQRDPILIKPVQLSHGGNGRKPSWREESQLVIHWPTGWRTTRGNVRLHIGLDGTGVVEGISWPFTIRICSNTTVQYNSNPNIMHED